MLKRFVCRPEQKYKNTSRVRFSAKFTVSKSGCKEEPCLLLSVRCFFFRFPFFSQANHRLLLCGVFCGRPRRWENEGFSSHALPHDTSRCCNHRSHIYGLCSRLNNTLSPFHAAASLRTERLPINKTLRLRCSGLDGPRLSAGVNVLLCVCVCVDWPCL